MKYVQYVSLYIFNCQIYYVSKYFYLKNVFYVKSKKASLQ